MDAHHFRMPDCERVVFEVFQTSLVPHVNGRHPDGEWESSIYDQQPWQDLPFSFLSPEYAGALSDEGFAYYLPAYLIATSRCDWMDITALMARLYTPGVPTPNLFEIDPWWADFNSWNRLMDSLSMDQKAAVRLWVEVMTTRSQDEETRRQLMVMLANYWSAF